MKRHLNISPKEMSILGVIAMKSKISADIMQNEIDKIELGTDASIVANILIQQMRNVTIAADQRYINLANNLSDWAESMRVSNLKRA